MIEISYATTDTWAWDDPDMYAIQDTGREPSLNPSSWSIEDERK